MKSIKAKINHHKFRNWIPRRHERGQAVVLFVISFMAIMAFVGISIDVASVYITYMQLKRAVDGAAVAAASNYKHGTYTDEERKSFMTGAAREMLVLNNVTDVSSLAVYECGDSSLPSDFATMCPDVGSGDEPRKLAWVQATLDAPIYFMSLFGFETVPITTSSVGEAATVDLVIVIDASQSMAAETSGDKDPDVCNPAGSCQPMEDAKTAAKALVDEMIEGNDWIAVVSFDFTAHLHTADPFLIGDFDDVKTAIDSIQVIKEAVPTAGFGEYNPFDVEKTFEDVAPWGKEGPNWDPGVSTCTGCGIRRASEILKNLGRDESVWVIVLLADGATNASDVYDTAYLPAGDPLLNSTTYPNGFCGGSPVSVDNPAGNMWDPPFCADNDATTRYCGPYHAAAANCPTTNGPYGTVSYDTSSPPYSSEDYAYDMTDFAALLFSENGDEPTVGSDITIYTIGYGFVGDFIWAENLLRYMANVGKDGTRLNDPCAGQPQGESCGNYYYTSSSDNLDDIFVDIADRIYTRISR
jgi:hypothetical protein